MHLRSAILSVNEGFSPVNLDEYIVAVRTHEATICPLFTKLETYMTAKIAIALLIAHFWVGSPSAGHFVSTHGGLPSQRPEVWENAQATNAVYCYYMITGDADSKKRIGCNWKWISATYPLSAWRPNTADGGNIEVAHAQDDAAWACALAIQAYTVTHDADALIDAETLLKSTWLRWRDRDGVGMFYDDDRKVKSLYQAQFALDALDVYNFTHVQVFLDMEKSCYQFCWNRLRRPDGLYYCDFKDGAALGIERPDDIHAASSVSYLEGNMAMAILCRETTGLDGGTSAAIVARYQDGVSLLDDRDAWTDAFLASRWRHECAVDCQMSPIALSGDWSGGAAWSAEANQMMTQANAVDMFVAGDVSSYKAHRP